MDTPKLSILLVDDHPIYSLGLRTALSVLPYINQIDETRNGSEALAFLEVNQANIVLMDICISGMDGVFACKEIRRLNPKQKVIGLSMDDNVPRILEMIRSGAMGYLLKDADVEELDRAIRQVNTGHKYFSNQVSQMLIEGMQTKQGDEWERELSMELRKDRVRDVIYLMCNELTSAEIAHKLTLSSRTIEYYRRKIHEITQSKNSIGVMRFALRNRILDDENLIRKWGLIN